MLPKDLAIVGNAPKEIGLQRGGEIDSFTAVARFNNFPAVERFQQDYGKKTTHWATSLYLDIEERDWSGPVLIPVPILSMAGGRPYRYSQSLYEKYRDQITVIPDEIFLELKQYLPNPSTGISFLFWVYREVGLTENQVFGFNFFSEITSHHYFESNAKCYHSGQSELCLFREMLDHRI